MSVKRGLKFGISAVVSVLFLGTLLPVPVQAQTASWRRQFGFVGDDTFTAVTTDSNGNIYVAGYFEVSLDGNIDALLVKYNSSGTLVWRERAVGRFQY